MGRHAIYSSPLEAAEVNRRKTAERNALNSAAAREIAPMPCPENRERRESCRNDLLRFMQTYGGTQMPYPFCAEQLELIHAAQDVLLHGGETPLCIFRGGCKTTICEWGLLWAAAYGHQRFSVVVAANAAAAHRIINNIKLLIEDADSAFFRDFPEICYPIFKLNRVWQRAATQTLHGVRTDMTYAQDAIAFPHIPGADSAGARIHAFGLDSSFRGLRVGTQRPTAVLIDDPQTNKTAKSPKQTDDRWETLTGSIKGLAGPGVQLAILATVTVIRPDDLAERILAKWGGKRFPLLTQLPTNMDAWELYAAEDQALRDKHLTTEERSEHLNAYYLAHREELDAGAKVAWEYVKTPEEVSGIQHAMNLWVFDRRAFWAEYQNAPLEAQTNQGRIQLSDLERKILPGLPKGVVPADNAILTAGLDIQKDCLYWLVTAWTKGGAGHVIDYGRFPKGRQTLQKVYPGQGLEQQHTMGLTELCNILNTAAYRKEDGEILPISHVLIDANWGITTQLVRRVCKNFGRKFEPTLGWGAGPDQSFFRFTRKPGEDRGDAWRKPPLKECTLVRHYVYDTNVWKSKLRDRILTPTGGIGSVTFFHAEHPTLFQHLQSESSSVLTGRYGTKDKWALIPGEPNHFWDCLTMSLVAFDTCGMTIPSGQNPGQTSGQTPVFCDLTKYRKK